jgi:hypothetical protein
MTQAYRQRLERSMGWVTLTAASVAVLYWVVYFTDASALGVHDEFTRVFESAFPVADGVLAVLLLAASRCLFAGKCEGAPLLIAGGAMAVYLGLLDFTFYAGRGLYDSVSTAAAIELAINALCLAGGIVSVRLGWLLWRSA